MTAHRRPLSRRWLAAGGAAVLAALLGVGLVLQNSGSACAAPPATSVKKGKATFYDLGGGMGNCSFPKSPADDLFVALSPDQYAAGAACGTYLDVTGPKGKVRVKVTDQCPECSTDHLDLSRTAFKKIGDEVQGIIPITYRTVTDVSTPGRISVRVKEGSSQYWLAVLIDNHANRLASVTVNGRRAHRESFNYWVIDGGAGKGPFAIKITDGYGRSTTASSIKLSPGLTQTTAARLSGGAVRAESAAAASPRKAKRKAAAKATTSPATRARSTGLVAPPLELAEPTTEATTEPSRTTVDLAAEADSSCD